MAPKLIDALTWTIEGVVVRFTLEQISQRGFLVSATSEHGRKEWEVQRTLKTARDLWRRVVGR
jgi:hypothetical protein